MIYLLKLLLAHILADFPLQPSSLVRAKQSANHVISLLALTIHSLIHALLTYVLIALWSNWLIPLVIFTSHFVVDFLKIKITKDSMKTSSTAFIIDQLAHVLVLAALGYFIFLKPSDALALNQLFNNLDLWIIVTSYLVVLKPSSVLLRKFLERWTHKSEEPDCQNNVDSLQSAGVWIGYLERTLILTFIFLNYFEGIGFLLAAKSIFRFGDLGNPSEVKQTEYVLVGTLASIAIAVFVGGVAFFIIKI